jgi:hypothetical protein
MGSETRRATETLTFRLTPEELGVVRNAAQSRGVGLTAWARRLLLDAAGTEVPPYRAKRDVAAVALGRLLGELGRIGSNVNQLAKVANASGDVAGVDVCLGMRDQLARLHADLLAELGEDRS